MNMMVLIAALIAVESGGDTKAIGDGGKAVGCLQIHPIFVEDVNRIMGGEHFFLSDRLDRMKSIEMAKIWLAYYKGKAEEKYGFEPVYAEMAVIFNRGYKGYQEPHVDVSTDKYWLKVEKALNELGDW